MRRLWKLVSNEKLFEKPCEDNNDNRYPQWHVQGLLHPPTPNFLVHNSPFCGKREKTDHYCKHPTTRYCFSTIPAVGY